MCVCNEFMLLRVYETELFKLNLLSTGMCMYKGDNQLNVMYVPYICIFSSCSANKHILIFSASAYVTDLSLKVLLCISMSESLDFYVYFEKSIIFFICYRVSIIPCLFHCRHVLKGSVFCAMTCIDFRKL